MSLVRLLARPLLSAPFIASGIDKLRKPQESAEVYDSVVDQVGDKVSLPENTDLIARVVGGVQIGAGALFAIGKFPRASALVLAATTLPEIFHKIQNTDFKDSQNRADNIAGILGSTSVLGALLLASVDTAGRPGIAWRIQNNANPTAGQIRTARRIALQTIEND